MKLLKKCSVTVSAALVLSAAGIALANPALAATVDPAISGDANASNGTVAFYNSAGARVTSGSDLTHLFDYALASTDATRASTKATVFFGFPDHTKADSTTWFESQQSASTVYPKGTAPAPLNSSTHPLVTLTSGDGNLQGLLSTTTQDQTAGFKDILQVRVYDTGPGVPKTAPFWATDISYDSVAGTWQQEFPAPPSLTAPGTPTGVGATPKDASADITWTDPASDGGAAITKYTIIATPPSGPAITKDVTGASATSGTITGLTNGTQYAVTVTATNSVGTSAASSPAVNVTPVAAPTAPAQVTGLTATAGDTTAHLSWTAPSNGGSAITSYVVSYTPQGGSASTVDTGSTGTTYNLGSLTNGTQYSVTVAAKNAIGTGTASNVATGTPATKPSAPTGVGATPHNASADVTWTAPASNGGATISKYTVIATPSAGSPITKDVASGTSTTITGLTNGTTYNITVTATNSAGTSDASSPAVAVTPVTAPGAPTGVTAIPGNTQADISWTAPSTGGSPIEKYTVTLTPAAGSPVTKDVTGATSTTVTGLSNGTQYAVTVTATNAVGTGSASTPVNVTPGLTATSLTLALDHTVVVQGQPEKATGTLTGADVSGKTVNLRFLMPGHTTVTRTATTSASGTFSYTFTPGFNTTVIASFAGEAGQSASTSPARGVVVRPNVHIASPVNGTTTHARTITIKGSATPNKAGTIVELVDRRTGTVLLRSRIASNGTFSFTRTFTKGSKLLYVHVLKTSDNAEGFSFNLSLHLV